MGLSKKNPKSNFNWQTRYLKKKAICCGELNEPGPPPPPVTFYILAENMAILNAENNDKLITE
jgi:hypothetical protein